jgi:hypothetical protein
VSVTSSPSAGTGGSRASTPSTSLSAQVGVRPPSRLSYPRKRSRSR